jgi:hypothetical protein
MLGFTPTENICSCTALSVTVQGSVFAVFFSAIVNKVLQVAELKLTFPEEQLSAISSWYEEYDFVLPLVAPLL